MFLNKTGDDNFNVANHLGVTLSSHKDFERAEFIINAFPFKIA